MVSTEAQVVKRGGVILVEGEIMAWNLRSAANDVLSDILY